MIKVCHFSDWHGHTRQLPPADIYVCTGDMLSNYPVIERDRGHPNYRGWKIDREHEFRKQSDSLMPFYGSGGFPALMGNPDAPVVCVRGNHDFIELSSMFLGCKLVYELIDNELLTVPVDGAELRVTGHRGIPLIFGNWNDETMRPDLIDRVRRMPEADLFLTHYPPAGILDASMPPGLSMGGGWAESYGLEGMANEIVKRVSSDFQLTDDGLAPETPARAAHCFGHIHECGGCTTRIVDVIFSNAATTFNTFEIEPLEG